MKIKGIGLALLTILSTLSLASCKIIDEFIPSSSNSTIKGEDLNEISKMKVKANYKPSFNAYKEKDNYKSFYFKVGEVENVSINSSNSYFYDGIEEQASFNLSMISERDIKNSLDEKSNLVFNKGSYKNSYLLNDKGSNHWKIADTASIGMDSYSNLNIDISFLEPERYYTIVNDNMIYINDPFYRLLDLGYNKETSTTVNLKGDYPTGYYRYSLLASCDAYTILTLDSSRKSYSINYRLYPKSFSYGIEMSRSTSFDDSLISRLSFKLDSILDNLNYEKPKAKTYNVTINKENGSSNTIVEKEEGTILNKPADPVRSGYIFGGWYLDYTYNNEATFPMTVNSNVTLYAMWIIDSKNLKLDLYDRTLTNNSLIFDAKFTNNTGKDIYKIVYLGLEVRHQGVLRISAEFNGINMSRPLRKNEVFNTRLEILNDALKPRSFWVENQGYLEIYTSYASYPVAMPYELI